MQITEITITLILLCLHRNPVIRLEGCTLLLQPRLLLVKRETSKNEVKSEMFLLVVSVCYFADDCKKTTACKLTTFFKAFHQYMLLIEINYQFID